MKIDQIVTAAEKCAPDLADWPVGAREDAALRRRVLAGLPSRVEGLPVVWCELALRRHRDGHILAWRAMNPACPYCGEAFHQFPVGLHAPALGPAFAPNPYHAKFLGPQPSRCDREDGPGGPVYLLPLPLAFQDAQARAWWFYRHA